jgi:hypothetical protein
LRELYRTNENTGVEGRTYNIKLRELCHRKYEIYQRENYKMDDDDDDDDNNNNNNNNNGTCLKTAIIEYTTTDPL